MVIHTAIGLFQKYHKTLCCPSKILQLHCFQFLLGRKAYCLLIHYPVLSSICQVLIKSHFFLNASNSSVSIIIYWWTEYCFSQRIVKSHAYPLVYRCQPRATLCNRSSRQTFLFECDQPMLWLPIVEHRMRAFLTYNFKKRFIKNISCTGLNFNRVTV